MNRLETKAAIAVCCCLFCHALPVSAQPNVVRAPSIAMAHQLAGNLFTTPPAPERLADILFKPRYRSAMPRSESNELNSPVFSMLIHFAFDSSRIELSSLGMLDSIGQMLQMPRLRHEGLVIEGHTDGVGGASYNQGLSEKRANAIKSYLVASFGLDPDRLVTVGYGKSRLHEPSRPLSATNRRVAFRALPSLQVK